MVDNAAFQPDSIKIYETFPPKVASADGPRERRAETKPSIQNEKIELKKDIGFFSCIGILVGSIIGSGIFIAPKGVLQGTGSIGATLIVWVVCGFFAFMGALTFVELGTMIPVSGGIYRYTLDGLAPKRKEKKLFWGPMVGFLYSWQNCFFSRPAAMGVQAMSISSYLMKLNPLACTDPDDEAYQISMKIISVFILTSITAINCFSVNVSTKFINFFTVSKLFALICIIVGGFTMFARGTSEALSTGFDGTTLSPDGITTAIYSGLWAYAGWDNLNNVTREVKNVEKNMVRAVIVSVLLVTVIYILTNISYFVLLTKTEFVKSDAVAVDFAVKLVGYFGGLFMIASVVGSIFGSTTGGSFTGARIMYAAAREGHLVDFLAFLNVKYRTPIASLIFTHLISMMMIWSTDILGLVFLGGFTESIFMSIVMICFLIMRKTKKDLPRVIKIPLVAPILSLMFTSFLVVSPFVKNPRIEYFYVIIFLSIGVVFYTIFVYYAYRVSCLDSVRKYVQLFLNLLPPQDVEM